MNTKITKLTSKITCLAVLAAALAAAPALTRAADSTNAAGSEMHTPKKRTGALPMHGKVVSVDAAAMSFVVGTNTLVVSSTTKITKEEKPAVFADIAVGENVNIAYKKDAEGKLNATTVRIGIIKKKTEHKPADKPAAPPQ